MSENESVSKGNIVFKRYYLYNVLNDSNNENNMLVMLNLQYNYNSYLASVL